MTEEARKNASQARQETERPGKALADNQALRMTVDDLNTRYRKANDKAKRKNDALLDRINRGDVRVSVAARACSELPSGSGTAADDGETRAELDSKTVGRILAVGVRIRHDVRPGFDPVKKGSGGCSNTVKTALPAYSSRRSLLFTDTRPIENNRDKQETFATDSQMLSWF